MYSKKFKPERYARIEDILEKMQSLAVGSSFQVKNLSPWQLRKVHWLLCDWRHHMEVVDVFPIRTTRGELVISRVKELSEANLTLDYVIEKEQSCSQTRS